MEGSWSSETLVSIYQITRCLIPEDCGFDRGKFEVTVQKYRERNGFTFFTSCKVACNADSLNTPVVIRNCFTAVRRKVTYKFLTSNVDIESTQQGGIPYMEQTAFHCNQSLFRHTRIPRIVTHYLRNANTHHPLGSEWQITC